MILLVDNYDSFTYNLAHYLCELGAEVAVRRPEELGARLETHEHNLLDLVIALGRNCLQTAERMTPAKPAANGGGGGSSSETHIAAVDICEVPAFARPAAPRRLWRIPAVSCFLMATTGLLALHYLVV